MIRSDSGVTHRLSLSARVLSTMSRQVKAKTHSGRSTSDIEENQARETYMAAEYRRRNPCSRGQIPCAQDGLRMRSAVSVSSQESERGTKIKRYYNTLVSFRLGPPSSRRPPKADFGPWNRSIPSPFRVWLPFPPGAEIFALNPRHHRRRHCRRQPDRPPGAACGPGRPTTFDRCRWRRAASHANRARSPCRLRSR